MKTKAKTKIKTIKQNKRGKTKTKKVERNFINKGTKLDAKSKDENTHLHKEIIIS
jgi:hypothetical protein